MSEFPVGVAVALSQLVRRVVAPNAGHMTGPGTNTYLVGVDEVALDKGHVSWISPIAKALLKAEEGDVVKMRTPQGVEEIEIVSVTYA